MIKKILPFLTAVIILGCGTKPPVATTTPVEPVKKEKPIPVRPIYRSAYTRYVDLIHTRLNVSFDWKHKELSGKAAIILRPHFYPTDSLTLNARGMDLKEVALFSNGRHIPLKYEYDSLRIHIHLDRIYSKDESLTLFINYIARPETLKKGGSDAITNDKGLYFIDADSLDSESPTEVWTQGETESNSAWFPTIEDPQQKMTQEIYITVDTAMTTLSNGLLISTSKNPDGTKTDYWKQSLPAAPYLTMIAAGKFSVVHDKYKNIDVNYYVDPPYEKYARLIFGNTPEMINFFSEKLGIPFVWEKYSQIVVHDYVSGAMENATAVVHGTNMQQDSGEYYDYNYEDYISHELFHHWFGDLVTCESWSNITLNEGFANYAEYLWREFKFGKDDADRLNQDDQSIYLYVATEKDPSLIRFNYADREDVYDAISYNKGGRVLHMLRKYVGDSAFFSSLHDYLSTHMFGTAEVNDLRMAFEKTTGEDLNWFFDEWYMKGGHPSITIDYNWNDSLHRETVTIKQRQNFDENPLYKIPMYVDLYYNGKTERKKITVDQASQDFNFDLPVKPDLVNVDADKMLLCTKTDHKSNTEIIFQYDHAPLFLDRDEAVTKIGSSYRINTPEAEMMLRALHDKYYSIRVSALGDIGELAMNAPDSVKGILRKLATFDPSPDVREKALFSIGKYLNYQEFSQVFNDALKDSSHQVVARAFKVISGKDSAKAIDLSVNLEKDSSNAVLGVLSEFYTTSTANKIAYFKRAIRQSEHYTRYQIIRNFEKYLATSIDTNIISAGANVLFEREKNRTSKANISALHEIENSLKDKISNIGDEIDKIKDAKSKADKQSLLSAYKTLKSGLHERIDAIDKK